MKEWTAEWPENAGLVLEMPWGEKRDSFILYFSILFNFQANNNNNNNELAYLI